MRNVITIAVFTVMAILILHWATRANEVSEKDESKAVSLKETEIQYAQIVEKDAAAKLASQKKETGASDSDLSHLPVARELRLAKAWIAYLNDPTNESPAEVSAEIILESAQDSLLPARELYARAPTMQTKVGLSQCELKVELARARLTIVKAMRKASPEEKLQWVSRAGFKTCLN